MTSRDDGQLGNSEDFDYDNLNRLVSTPAGDISYDTLNFFISIHNEIFCQF